MRLWTIFLFLIVISIASAYPIGIVPSVKTECIQSNSTGTFYLKFYNGAVENKTFNVYLQDLTWASFSNETIIQSGMMNVPANTSIPVYVYAIAPENLSEKVYNITLYICNIPPQNQTLNFRLCLPGYFVLNVEDECNKMEVNNQTWIDNPYNLYIVGVISAAAILLVILYLIRRSK